MGAKFFYKNIDLVYFVNNKLINNNLITQKDRMLLSFSGGQDSICFVFILNQLYSQLEFDITFFWCHHLWQTDSFYLMQQITKLSFLLQFNSCFPIPLNSISSELLARKWRQRCSYRVSLFYNYSKICLAHTFNDKVENIFLNFIRGTGLIGLAPLRWTQFISKSNITNEKHISCEARHNYLNNSCSTKMHSLTPYPVQSFALQRAFCERVAGKSSICLPRAKRSFAIPVRVWGMGYPNSDANDENGSAAELRLPLILAQRERVHFSGRCASTRSKDYFTEQSMLYPSGVSNWHKVTSCDKQYKLTSGAYPLDSSRVRDMQNKWYRLPLANRRLTYPMQSSAKMNLQSPTGYGVRGISKICTTYPLPLQGTQSFALNGVKVAELNFVQSKTSSVAELRTEHGKQLLNCGKDCYIVRPLLSISRIELNKICYFWKLPIYPDKSNQKVKFFRNRVRGQLLPTIKLFFNLNIENIFLQLATIIETEDYCLTQIVNEFTKNTDVYHTKLNIYSKKNNYT